MAAVPAAEAATARCEDGGTLTDRKGAGADVVLGHDYASGYEARQDFLRATVGRYANRVARGTFTIDGNTCRVPLNDGTNPGNGGCLYRMGDGFVLEPHKFPDMPNGPAFGSARLDSGQAYRHVMVLRPSPAK